MISNDGGGLLEIQTTVRARPLAEWHEDIGPCLWWRFPITERPWVGTPLDDDWLDGDPPHYTHWTPILLPAGPRDGDTVQVLPRDNAALQDILLLLEDYEVPMSEIAALTDIQYWEVHNHATASILSANDHDDIEIPPRPGWFLDKFPLRHVRTGDYSPAGSPAGSDKAKRRRADARPRQDRGDQTPADS